ncbi:MAG: lysophospholipid acyltransferase family protein [Opitutales bacterium]|nr:lysophospholipid acyltransferase family protein [Opitutales bacterium]
MPEAPLIDLNRVFKKNPGWRFLRILEKPISRFLGIEQINREYIRFSEQFQRGDLGQNPFLAVLHYAGVKYEVTLEDLEHIPEHAPLVVVSNHPFGAVDGVIMGAILSQRRPDVRILANELLGRIHALKTYLLEVNVFGGSAAANQNRRSIRQALEWVRSGGCVASFPSGVVSHLHLRNLRVEDPLWNDHLTMIALRSKAVVVPFYFDGRNSWLFHLAGLAHPMLRTVMLGRELLRTRGKSVTVRIGQPVSVKALSKFENSKECTRFLRLKSYLLRERSPGSAKVHHFPLKLIKKPKHEDPVVGPVSPELLVADINSLPEGALLLDHGALKIYVSKSEDIPNLLQEIGRLREITFRAIGEGTGRPTDIDEFDSYYLHLFIWNSEQKEVVGSYRMGLTDWILDVKGKKGLYTSTLFRLKDELLEELNPALELGRSFVRIEYQRKRATLILLWRGIGEFLGRNPHYTKLFGPVSITAEYSSISKDLMIQFLRENRSHPNLARWVKARKPHRTQKLRKLLHESVSETGMGIEDVSALISEVESDHKGIPVLLKHYLRLNGVLLSFNKDPKFSDVVDGLILVDLEQSDPSILRKHIGDGPYQAIQAHLSRVKQEA